MKNDDYRSAMDCVKLSEGFRQDTIEKLTHAAGQCKEREIIMKPKRTIKTAVLVAAAMVLLIASAAAAIIILTPKDVASRGNDTALANAFDSPGAVQINQSIESEGYTFTLAGLVSGAGISEYAQDVDTARTYVVASIANTDGTPIENAESNLDTMFTPLVSGYLPWRVNAWTLGGACNTFTENGVAYYLFECDNLEIFADRTVYLAAFQGMSPSNEFFQMNEDGSISFTDTIEGPHAMFTLPLDPSKADPEAARQLLADNGIESN